jgi:hypothetical protein
MIRQRFGQQPQQKNPIADSYRVHQAAVDQQAGDYDNIMSGYKNLLDSPLTSQYQDLFNKMQTGGQATFQNTPDAQAAISNLGELSRTGGLSEGDQANLRARGVSPIRAVYGNAQRNVNRQKSLQGGYSPGHGALTARMAREMSQGISDANVNVNAGIAEMVQRGKLSASPQYASAAGQERDSRNTMEMFNKRDLPGMQASVLDRIGGLQSDALRGMTSLYGTTPALANLYGNQAQNTAQLQDNIKHRNRGSGMQVMNRLYGGG